MESALQNVQDRRQICVFLYRPTEVLAAAKERLKHHKAREDCWTQEYNKAQAQLKKKGFEYRERSSSHEPHVQIVGDPELAQRVVECRGKIVEHRQHQKHYETWVRALKVKASRQPKEDLELAINDVMFFGL